MTLEEAREQIGCVVIYHAPGTQLVESGVVTSVNNRYVFVRYGSDVGSMATNPADLRLMHEVR